METSYKQLQQQRSAEVPQLKLQIETLTKSHQESKAAAAAECNRLKGRVKQLEEEAKKQLAELQSTQRNLDQALQEVQNRAGNEEELRRELLDLQRFSANEQPSHRAGIQAPAQFNEVKRPGTQFSDLAHVVRMLHAYI